MKTQSITTIAKRFFLGNLLAAAMFLSANASVHTNNVFEPTDKVEVRYTGVDRENQLSFKVKYSNPSGSSFSMSILDENGESLYKGFFNDKSFDKTFKLPKSEANKLTFLIEDVKNSVKEKYTVNIKTSVMEEVTVNRD